MKEDKDCSNLVILVVDDDPTNFQYIKIILKNIVKRTDHAVNGQEAVDLVMQNEYDVVLMDLNMPVMDGYEATKQIKQLLPNLPIIVQTAHVLLEEQDLAFKAGCDDLIAKPINKVALLNKINEQMSKKKTEDW